MERDYVEMVIVGSIGFDDIDTPEASGSDLLGGAATARRRRQVESRS